MQPLGQFVRNSFVVEIGKGDVRVAAQTGVGEQQDFAIPAVLVDDVAEGAATDCGQIALPTLMLSPNTS